MSSNTAALSVENEADEAQSFDEYKAIEKALQPYIDAAKSAAKSMTRIQETND